jgi:uncharacterized protein (TIGR03118 family)
MRTAVLALAAAALAASFSGAGASSRFVLRPLVSTTGPAAAFQDAQLVNPWGLTATATGPWWVANEGRSSSTVYASSGAKVNLTVDVPGGPTGVAYNGGSGFVVGHGAQTAPARFLYACEDGTIRAWSPTVPHGWSTQAVVAVDAGGSGAVFKGIALSGGRLYVTDFHNHRVLVFDRRWHRVVLTGRFHDPAIPSWYSPFNIAAFGGHLFVSYAFPAPVDGNDAPSGGYVDEFDLQGRLVARVARAGDLAEPWGLALAPAGFGRFGGDLLVASFGNGHIDAFAPSGRRWKPAGRLPVDVAGVWGIAFGTGGMSGPRTTLFYTSGPHVWLGSSENEVQGELGSISLPVYLWGRRTCGTRLIGGWPPTEPCGRRWWLYQRG